jgi:serine/threonine protein kinase
METQRDQARSSNLYDQLIDQYKLEAHINQTAVTDLYRAFDVDENRTVAIEILLPIFNNKKLFVEQFIAKMNKVAQLRHPNIAQVHQIGLTPNARPYIARDLIEGITLQERLGQLAQQPSASNSIYALKIISQLAEALELAERLDLYHYHLSPDNIQLKQDGTVVLVDLGIPAAENGTAVKLASHQNNAYIAPEQHQGKPIDSRSQIYSMGVILYEILTTELPPEPGSVWQNFSQAFTPQNTVLEQKRPDLSRQTYDLIEKSLRKQPWGRYATIREFLEAINEALQSERMLMQNRGDTTVLPIPAPRRSRAIILLPILAIIFCLGSAAAIWATVQNQNGIQPTSQAAANDALITTQTPTSTQAVMTPNANSEPTPSLIFQDTAVSGTINILAPANESEFQAGDTVSFRWNWPDTLQENQRFSIYLLMGNGRSLLGTVSTSATDGNYSLQTLLPESNNVISEWLIVLEDLSTNRDIATSNNQRIAIKPPPDTPTFTPSPTATPTITVSPTPIPQVEVIVSSASLRLGPGTAYPILRYLYQGDVVAVLAKDSAAGDWYNIILDDGSRGWLAAIASSPLSETSLNNIEIAVTVPPRPTNTPTPTPTNTPTPTSTYTPIPVPGGSDPQPPQPTTPPTPTPPPLPGG